jgi:glycine cleavage system aminomethyltransferase T
MERLAREAGARFEVRDGWNVAVEFSGGGGADTVGWADSSHLAKVELQGPADAIDAAAGGGLPFSTAVRRDGAWWCRLTQTRALVIGARPDLSGADGVDVLDVTSNFAAITLVGPLARETFARFCALDLRPHVTPVNALRPGSIGRQPGIVIREDEERYLFLFGWATGEYMWSVVADAGGHLGGRPVGADALREVTAAHA